MLTKATILAILAASASAHSVIPLVKGDVAGAMSGLGFDPTLPAVDKNKNVIEPDATTMPSNRNVNADGLGTLNNKKKITMDMAAKAIEVGGMGQMPQVNKQLDITYRQLVIDGRFDPAQGATVLIDPTATGTFSNAVEAKIISAPPVVKQATIKGTTVVGQDMQIKVEIPDNIQCTGPNNTCLARIINGKNEGNQRWGGNVLFQKVGPPAATVPAADPAAPMPMPATTGAPTKRHARDFTA